MKGPNRARNPRPKWRWHVLPVLALALLLLATPVALVSADTAPGPGTEVVSGVVYDERGVPAEGVLVKLQGTYLGTPTDVEGRFTLEGTDLEGSRVLEFSKVGFMTAEIVYDLEDSGSIDLSVYMVEEQALPGSLEGVVRSFTDEPIGNALLILRPIEGTSLTVLSDADGGYAFPEVQPSDGFLSLTVEAPGHTTQVLEVVITPGSSIVLDVTMAPDTPAELIKGRVLDERSLPLPGVKVNIEGSPYEWTTGLEGWFNALLDGRLGVRDVRLSLRGYQDTLVSVDIPEPGLAETDLSLPLAPDGGLETLWVRVVNDWTGEPVGRATVSLEGMNIARTTDHQGVAVLTGEELEGEISVVATKSSHTVAISAFVLEDGGTGVLTLNITRVSNAVTLEGVVVAASNGDPVPDASVLIDSGGIVWLTRTGVDGTFAIHNLPPGVLTTVRVSAEGYRDGQTETILQEYALNRVGVVLEELVPLTAWVDGTVVDLEGPVSGARVTIWNDEGFMAVTTSDTAGSFQFTGIPVRPGVVLCRVEHLEHATQQVTVYLPGDGGRVELNVPLETPTRSYTTVQGMVRDTDGFPVDGAQVSIGTVTESHSTKTLDGHFSFVLYIAEDIDAQLTVTAEGYGLNSRSAILQVRGSNWVNMTLPLGPDHGNVLGTVRTEAQRPLEGAEVLLTMSGVYRSTTKTGPDGSFAFRLVPASSTPYQLSVVAPGFNGATVKANAEAGRTSWYYLVVEEDVTSVETIQGTVRSAEGQPVANAVVRIGGNWNVVTDGNGSFVLVDEHLEGRWSVAASLPGFENTYEIVEVLSGATVAVELTLDVMATGVTSVGGSVFRASSGKPLEGATVRLARSASGTWTFETSTGPDGSFTFQGVPRAWDAVAVTVSYPGHHDDVAREMLSPVEATYFEFYMQRVVPPEPEEPMMTESEARQVGAGVSITLGALVIVLMTEVGRVALLGLILVPLYTKIKREKVMDHFVRGRIYEFVCQNPGVNYSAIKQQFKLTNGTVTYHLSMLERQEFIRSKQDGIYKRYFSNNGGPPASEVEPMSLQLIIAKTIRENPGLTQKEIAKKVRSSKQLVSYHIRRMKKEGQLDTRRDGRTVRVYANHMTPE